MCELDRRVDEIKRVLGLNEGGLWVFWFVEEITLAARINIRMMLYFDQRIGSNAVVRPLVYDVIMKHQPIMYRVFLLILLTSPLRLTKQPCVSDCILMPPFL